jgi:hypothetical protein
MSRPKFLAWMFVVAAITFALTLLGVWCCKKGWSYRAYRQYGIVAPNAVEWYTRWTEAGNTATARANALCVAWMLRVRGLDRTTPPIMVSAILVKWPQSHANELIIDAMAPDDTATHVVLVFKDEQGRTVQVLYKRDPCDQPIWPCSRVLTFLAFEVPMRGLSSAGCQADDGTVHLDGEDIHRLLASYTGLAVPEGDVAVGLRYPDGTYTNFVPLWRTSLRVAPSATSLRSDPRYQGSQEARALAHQERNTLKRSPGRSGAARRRMMRTPAASAASCLRTCRSGSRLLRPAHSAGWR